MAQMIYHANVERDGRFWLVHVPEIDQYTQARNLREVEAMVRDLVATWLEVDPDSFEVVVSIEVPEPARSHWDRSRRLLELVDELKAAAAAEAHTAAATLASASYTYRDIGAALGVSFQRAEQLVKAEVEAPPLEEVARATIDIAWPDVLGLPVEVVVEGDRVTHALGRTPDRYSSAACT